jgi:hypothetical protein
MKPFNAVVKLCVVVRPLKPKREDNCGLADGGLPAGVRRDCEVDTWLAFRPDAGLGRAFSSSISHSFFANSASPLVSLNSSSRVMGRDEGARGGEGEVGEGGGDFPSSFSSQGFARLCPESDAFKTSDSLLASCKRWSMEGSRAPSFKRRTSIMMSGLIDGKKSFSLVKALSSF